MILYSKHIVYPKVSMITLINNIQKKWFQLYSQQYFNINVSEIEKNIELGNHPI